MLCSGTDPESYITEHTLVYEDYNGFTSTVVLAEEEHGEEELHQEHVREYHVLLKTVNITSF